MSSSPEEEVVKRRVAAKRMSAISSRRKKADEPTVIDTEESVESIPVSKKTTTKRATKRAGATAKAPKRATTKSKKSTIPLETNQSEDSTVVMGDVTDTIKTPRKAPTTPVANTADSKRFPVALVVVSVIALALGGTGIWYGMSDPGQIDVETLVQRHNERVARGEAEGGTVGNAILPVQRPTLRPAAVAPTTDAEETAPLPAEAPTTTADSVVDESATSSSESEDTTLNETSTDAANEAASPVDEVANDGDTSYVAPRHVAQRQPFDFT